MFKKAFDFFIFSNLFVAVCAVAMVWQTCYLFQLLFSHTVAGFVFFGTLCSYNFHWYLTPNSKSSYLKAQWAVTHKKVHLILFIVGALGAGLLLYQPRQYRVWLLVAAFITFLYSAPKLPHYPFIHLRKIAIAKTLFVAFVWMYVTTFLPLILSGVVFNKAHYLFAFNRALFFYGICILFDFRDREQDKKEGLKGFITSSDEKRIDAIFWGCLVVYFSTCLLLYYIHFSLAVFAALLLPVVSLAFLYHPLKKNFSDYLYHFILDGLLIFSALLHLLFHF